MSPLTSIFPPDSIPAWTTIFTGRGPGDHGYLDSIYYLDDNTPERATTTAASALPHNAFWDVASERGMKVCVALEWMKERDEVVAGASIEKDPGVLFKHNGDFGVDFALYGGLFAPDVNHRRISGGDRPTGVFGSSVPVDPPASIEQFHDVVVGLLDRYASPACQ